MNRRVTILLLGTVAVAFLLFLWSRVLDTNWNRFRVSSEARELVRRLRVNPNDSNSIEALMKMTQSTYSFEAVVAVVAIGDIGDAAIPVIQDIAKLLKSDNSTIRREAARSLAKLGPRSREVLDVLVFHVGKIPSDDESWFSAEAIGEIGEPAIECLDLLRSRLGTGSPQFDDSLLKAIKQLESISNK
jgi:hypothetical protein